MATQQTMRTIVLKAGADLSADQFKALILDGSADAILSTAVTDVPVGILQNKPKSGERALIALLDGAVLKMKAGAAITINTQVGLHATDGLIDDVIAAGNMSLGIALEAAGGANEIISILSHLVRAHA